MSRFFAHALAVLAATASLAAPPAAPTRPPAPTPIKTSYEFSMGGQPMGTEDASIVSSAEGQTVTGSVRLKLPSGEATLGQETHLATGGSLVSYRLDIAAPGQALTLTTTPKEGGFTVVISTKGGAQPDQTHEVPAKLPVVLLDNSFASHIDLLTRRLNDLGPDQERAITILVPQVLQAIPGSVKRLADGGGTLDGQPVATRAYRIAVANLTEELVARGSDGALLRVEVPLQSLVIVRSGYAPAPVKAVGAAAGPAGDPRETATVVKGPAGELPATVLAPKAERAIPGVVLLSGSGPNDKDETIGPNKPFQDVSRALGDRGIASLRFDKRTHALKGKADATLAAEYFEDAAVAIRMLASTPGIDPKRVFLLGHSEGAMLAPTIAGQAGGVRGLVLMAPGVRPIDEMVIDQMAYGATLTGRSKDEIAEQTKLLQEKFAAIRDPKRADAPSVLGAPASYWREVIGIDVTKTVKDSKLPVLVLQGDKDIQVRKDLDFEVLRTAVGADGGRVTYQSFPGLNHLFMQVEGQSSGAEYGIAGHVDPAVTAAIADWILAR